MPCITKIVTTHVQISGGFRLVGPVLVKVHCNFCELMLVICCYLLSEFVTIIVIVVHLVVCADQGGTFWCEGETQEAEIQVERLFQ